MTREEAIKILADLTDNLFLHTWEKQNKALHMAIEALSAEEAVWNEYEAEFTDLPDIPRYYYEKVVGKMAHEINMLREQLESADAEQGWIPCSERLPNEDNRYLVVYPLIGGGNWISIKWFGKPNMPNRPIKGKCFYESDSEYGDVIWDNVIAWMPLPKPYREENEE